ncbi:hypothetical protein [uncultured Nostoc sp.]|uniref:hypothetical protein n=1 Tax=uncultured Nostoc sp. TaxID=340711 RepID=UPI0035CA0359
MQQEQKISQDVGGVNEELKTEEEERIDGDKDGKRKEPGFHPVKGTVVEAIGNLTGAESWRDEPNDGQGSGGQV